MRTLGTPSEVCEVVGMGEVAAVMSSNDLRSVMSLVGAVMPLSAAAHAEKACMSLSVGVREGRVMDLCWKTTVSLRQSLLVDLMWHLCVR